MILFHFIDGPLARTSKFMEGKDEIPPIFWRTYLRLIPKFSGFHDFDATKTELRDVTYELRFTSTCGDIGISNAFYYLDKHSRKSFLKSLMEFQAFEWRECQT